MSNKLTMTRTTHAKDINQIIDIWKTASSFAHPFLDIDFVNQVEHFLQVIYLPNVETWVNEDDHIVIGFISMLKNEMGGLFVLPSFHSIGIGTQLVNYVRNLYTDLEVEVFEKNIQARQFYTNYGFKEIHKCYHAESKHSMLRLQYQ